MLRLTYPSNKFQKRLIRPLYAQSQATPYAATLDASLRNSDGSIRRPLSSDTAGATYPFSRTADAFVYHNSLVPGTVVYKTSSTGDTVGVGIYDSGGTGYQPFGLLANFIGGDFDDVGEINSVGVWRGPDSVFEVLAPAFNDAGVGTGQQSLSTAIAGATTGVPVLLYCGTDGRLCSLSSANAGTKPVCRLVERTSAARIVVDMIV